MCYSFVVATGRAIIARRTKRVNVLCDVKIRFQKGVSNFIIFGGGGVRAEGPPSLPRGNCKVDRNLV
jgi:hypothetical protein